MNDPATHAAEDAGLEAMTAQVRRIDERNALMDERMRAAFKCLQPLINDLPTSSNFLLAQQAVTAWRTMRDCDPDTYLVYLSEVRRKLGNDLAKLIAARVGPPLSAHDVRLDPEAARVADIFASPPEPPRFIIEGIWPENVGEECAAGGLGKTTRHQQEHIHLVLGMPLYGRNIVKPGSVLVLSKEDTREELLYRYYRQALAMNLSDAERRAVFDQIFVEDLTGSEGRLAVADNAGNLVATGLAASIIKTYANEGITLVDFDPLNLFSPGERYVNDGEAKMMEIGRLISRELGCMVRFTAHVSKESARGRFVDSHAGRGGAAGGDNARFVHVFVPHDPEDDKTYPLPASVSTEAIAEKRIFRLHVPKVSGAPRIAAPFWLERDGYLFRHIEGAPPSQDEREQADVNLLRDFLAEELARGVRHTKHTLEDSTSALGLPRAKLRRALIIAEEKGKVVPIMLPEAERRGARTHYLSPVGMSIPAR